MFQTSGHTSRWNLSQNSCRFRPATRCRMARSFANSSGRGIPLERLMGCQRRRLHLRQILALFREWLRSSFPTSLSVFVVNVLSRFRKSAVCSSDRRSCHLSALSSGAKRSPGSPSPAIYIIRMGIRSIYSGNVQVPLRARLRCKEGIKKDCGACAEGSCSYWLHRQTATVMVV